MLVRNEQFDDTINLQNFQESNVMVKSINDSSFCQGLRVTKDLFQREVPEEISLPAERPSKISGESHNETRMKFGKKPAPEKTAELPRQGSFFGPG